MARNSLKNVKRLIDNIQKELPVNESFLHDLQRSIEFDDRKNTRQPSRTYKPSSMHCIRNMYYQVIGASIDDEPASYNFIGICNSGTDTHVRIQKAISGMILNGINCSYVDVAEYVKQRDIQDLKVSASKGMETKLYHEKLNMSFMCDGIVKYKDHYYILEIKTESSNKFWMRKDVDANHHNQATAYSIALGIDEVLFLYINRDTLDMKCFLFNVTGSMKEHLVGKIEECDQYVRRMIAPPKPAELTKTTCSYCPYKTQCRKDG